MKIAFYNTKAYEEKAFKAANNNHTITFIKEHLDEATVQKAAGHDAVCCFVTDSVNASVLTALKSFNVQLVALRSAGYDHVDLSAAKMLGLAIVRVPAYSPEAIAEFALGLILSLSRKIVQGHDKIKHQDFTLEGLMGFNLSKKTVGIIGTGYIGSVFAKLLSGFECKLLAYDPYPKESCVALGVNYTSKEQLFNEADIISLHCPLNQETHYLINSGTLSLMKPNVILINTARGAIIDTSAVIEALGNQKIGALGLDVYENERTLFFEDHSRETLKDEQFIRLQAFPNVLITGHQAFFSQEAFSNIVKTTLENITAFEQGRSINQI